MLFQKKSVVLVQIVRRYYEFSLLEKVLKKELIKPNTKIIGLESKVVYFKISDYIFIFPYLIKLIINEIRRYKWRKIYSTLGVDVFIKDNNSIKYWKTKDFIKLNKIFFKTKKKKQVLQINLNDVLVGDLIYDGYLRYYNKPTISLLNFKFLSILSHTIGLKRKIEKIISKYNLILYIAQYSNYVNSGIPCREILKNNIKILAVGNDLNLVKELKKNDFRRAPNHKFYKYRFNKIEDKKEKIDIGLKRLKKRFSGEIDIVGMKNSSFSNKSNKLDSNIEGVVFLHDIFDAQHIYDGGFCFNDLYEWTLFNLNLIRKEKLKIGVKPHINQRIESQRLIEKLKEEFDDIYWIDSKISNLEIFKNISFGSTVFGTIITELAYFGILPISCGDNPTSSFGFDFQAKTPEEYRSMLINYKSLSNKYNPPTKDQIGAFVYMHYESNISQKYSNIKLDRINLNSNILNEL